MPSCSYPFLIKLITIDTWQSSQVEKVHGACECLGTMSKSIQSLPCQCDGLLYGLLFLKESLHVANEATPGKQSGTLPPANYTNDCVNIHKKKKCGYECVCAFHCVFCRITAIQVHFIFVYWWYLLLNTDSGGEEGAFSSEELTTVRTHVSLMAKTFKNPDVRNLTNSAGKSAIYDILRMIFAKSSDVLSVC